MASATFSHQLFVGCTDDAARSSDQLAVDSLLLADAADDLAPVSASAIHAVGMLLRFAAAAFPEWSEWNIVSVDWTPGIPVAVGAGFELRCQFLLHDITSSKRQTWPSVHLKFAGFSKAATSWPQSSQIQSRRIRSLLSCSLCNLAGSFSLEYKLFNGFMVLLLDLKMI
jgi:hypothetical protein